MKFHASKRLVQSARDESKRTISEELLFEIFRAVYRWIKLPRQEKRQSCWESGSPGNFLARLVRRFSVTRKACREGKANNLTNPATLIWKTHIVGSRYRAYRFLCRQKSASRFQRTSRNGRNQATYTVALSGISKTSKIFTDFSIFHSWHTSRGVDKKDNRKIAADRAG